MAPGRTVEKLFLLCLLACAVMKDCNAALTITQGRIILDTPVRLEKYDVVGLATVELGGDPESQPNYFFDCVTDRNNGSGLRWTRSFSPHQFTVGAIPDNVPGQRMDVSGIDSLDLDIYICSDQYSSDVVTLNITDFNPAIIAAEERVEVLQDENAVLEIYVSGYPVPIESDITWRYPNSSTITKNDAGVSFTNGGRRLILSNVTADQAGLYTCSVVISLSPYMGSFTYIQLEVHVPTIFVTQPVESIDAIEWNAVTLTCSASGVPTPQIRWERENHPTLPVGAQTPNPIITGNTTTSQLVFSKIRYEAIGRYRCMADNGETDPVMSRYADVRVSPALRLYDSRMQVINDLYSVNNGTAVILECFGSGNLGWTSSTGLEIPSSESGSIYQSYDQTRDALALTISNFMSSNSAVYTCTTDLTDILNSPITASVLITSSNPAVIQLSRVQYVIAGDSTTLEARVYASPSNMANVRWHHEDRLIDDANEDRYTASSEGDIYRLEVNGVSVSELGKYTIVVTLNGRTANDTATLSYPEPPSATITPSSATVNEGEAFTLTCEAGGSGALTVSWTMADSNPLPVGVQERGNELIIASATTSHSGTYVCTVSNLAGTSQDEVILTVYYKPRVVVTFDEMSSMPGQPLYLVRDNGAPGPTVVCSADGHLSPTIKWVQVNGRGLPNGITQSHQPNGVVQLRWQRPMEFTDSGSYICQASNIAGNGSATLEVLVQIEPSISSIYPFSNDITQDTETFSYTVPRNYIGSTLVCAVKGWPAPEVEWQKDGQPLPSSGSVVSESSTMVATVSARLRWTREFLSSDAGSYECVVRKPNTVVPTTSQIVQLKAGNTPATGSTETCSVNGQTVYFQIRVFRTDCENWGTSLSTNIATEFRNELLNVVRTECECEVEESELEVISSPQCSSKVNGAAVFRGQIQTSSQTKTEDTFCALFSWQQKSPLIRINEQFRAVDTSCSLRASESLNSEECVAPAGSSSIEFGPMEIAYAVGAAAAFLLLVLVIVLLICCVGCYYCQRGGRKGEFNVSAAEETDHTYARTDSFSKYSHNAVRSTGPSSTSRDAEEPVYSTLTRDNEPPHEAIALSHIVRDSDPNTSDAVDSALQAQSSRSQLPTAHAYQIPVSSQENLTSPAPGSVGNFQAMKRHTSSTSATGYDSTSHLLSPIQKTRPSNSPTDDRHNMISATSPFNDYEHIDGDDAFMINSPSSISDSPTIPGNVQEHQQSFGNLGPCQPPRNPNQATGAMSASVPLGLNPQQTMGLTMFAVVEEDKEDMTEVTGFHQRPQRTGEATSRSLQQTLRVGGNHSPSGSTGSSSSHGMKQALMAAHFQSADSMTNPRSRESNYSEAPPPYTSRPSSEAVLTADSADSSMSDNKNYGGIDSHQRAWYQASDLSIDSNIQSNAPPTSSSSQASTSTEGGRIQPYAMIHNENIPYAKHQTSGTSIKESHAHISRKSSNQQKPGSQIKPPVQPYTEPVRSSVVSLGHAQESSTFFEVVV